jgi:myo-inositol-1(or 4)-monophosphatase
MNLSEITNKIIAVAKEAGGFIREERNKFDSGRVEIKGRNDLVSYVDKESEKMIVKSLREIFSEAGFIAEENSASGQKEFNWIIDPLDGTTNFIHGIPCYCVSIALARGTEILSGVVLEISRDECFHSFQGEKSFMNGKEISVTGISSLSDALVATGFPVSNFDRIDGNMEAVKHFMKNTHGVRRIGSAAADLCFLACGRVDAFFEYNLKPWDVAAGALIVQNAGGIISDFSGGGDWLFGREIMGSGKGIFTEFSKAVNVSFEKRD